MVGGLPSSTGDVLDAEEAEEDAGCCAAEAVEGAVAVEELTVDVVDATSPVTASPTPQLKPRFLASLTISEALSDQESPDEALVTASAQTSLSSKYGNWLFEGCDAAA
jgi:hypothetical protein